MESTKIIKKIKKIKIRGRKANTEVIVILDQVDLREESEITEDVSALNMK